MNESRQALPRQLGLRHLALTIVKLEACVVFYQDILGMTIEWQPDDDNVYLTSGNDNLALHRAPKDYERPAYQALDHLGFILASPKDVKLWYDHMVEQDVVIQSDLKSHRDGAHSFYCLDPDGNAIQMIYHPPISQS